MPYNLEACKEKATIMHHNMISDSHLEELIPMKTKSHHNHSNIVLLPLTD